LRAAISNAAAGAFVTLFERETGSDAGKMLLRYEPWRRVPLLQRTWQFWLRLRRLQSASSCFGLHLFAAAGVVFVWYSAVCVEAFDKQVLCG
jgi:hypothetical protein